MKTFLFTILALFSLNTFAQVKGTAKLYGYEQSVSRGKAPEVNPETGLRTSSGAGKNYFLYAVSSSRIYPVELWIEGTQLGVTMRTISQTPVELTDELLIGSPKKVLVPKTTQRVIQLSPTPATAAKQTGTTAKKLAASNSVVLVYKQNGKFYYAVLPTLSTLDNAVAQ